MYGSTDMTRLRTSTSPSRGCRTSASASRKSSGTGQPRGRRTSCHSRLVGMSVLLRSDEHCSGGRVGHRGREHQPVDGGSDIRMWAPGPERTDDSTERSDDKESNIASGSRLTMLRTPAQHEMATTDDAEQSQLDQGAAHGADLLKQVSVRHRVSGDRHPLAQPRHMPWAPAEVVRERIPDDVGQPPECGARHDGEKPS